MDKAYEVDKTRKLAINYGHGPVVQPKKSCLDSWKYDVEIYELRNILERLFRWLKVFRKVLT